MLPLHREAKPFYPPELAPLYTPEGVVNREAYARHIWGFVGHHRRRVCAPAERAYLDALNAMPAGNILVPSRAFLSEARAPFDLIAVSCTYRTQKGHTKCAAFMEEYTPGSPVREGTGKTGLALALLGVSIPRDEIPYPRSRENPCDAYEAIAALDRTPPHPLPHENKETQLIATDLLYVGVDGGGKLVGAGAVAEPFIAQWDTARHISRAFDAYYKDKDGKTVPWLKEYMLKLAEKWYLQFGEEGVFGNPFAYRELNELYIVNPRGKSGAPAERVSGIEAKRVVEMLLLRNPVAHPAYPHSSFWKLHEDEHMRRVGYIMGELARVPRVRRVGIAPTPARTHVREAAAVVRELLEED